MDFSLKVATKTDSKTIVKEYAPIMTAADYVTNRTNSPGKFTFSTVEDKGIDIYDDELFTYLKSRSFDYYPKIIGYDDIVEATSKNALEIFNI